MDIIRVSEEFAKKEYAKHDEAHKWSHVEEVMGYALELAKSQSGVDLEILKLAVILHDISYEFYETHVEDSLKVAEKFLREQKYPEERIRKVLSVMVAHSGPHRRKLGDSELIEGKIIFDADKLTLSKTTEGFKKYFPRFYLDESREMAKMVGKK